MGASHAAYASRRRQRPDQGPAPLPGLRTGPVRLSGRDASRAVAGTGQHPEEPGRGDGGSAPGPGSGGGAAAAQEATGQERDRAGPVPLADIPERPLLRGAGTTRANLPMAAGPPSARAPGLSRLRRAGGTGGGGGRPGGPGLQGDRAPQHRGPGAERLFSRGRAAKAARRLPPGTQFPQRARGPAGHRAGRHRRGGAKSPGVGRELPERPLRHPHVRRAPCHRQAPQPSGTRTAAARGGRARGPTLCSDAGEVQAGRPSSR
ncbi:hypothetical protein SALBM311S_03647 [Streptomyces alboniger]